jgi:hypothetical protein
MSRQAATALFFLCFGTYAWFYQAGGWNQNSRFDLTRAIVERGTIRIDAYEGNTGDKSLRAGHFYCDKAPGLSWLCVLPAALTPGSPDVRAYVATLFGVALPSAIAVVLLFWILGRLGLPPAAAIAWGLASLALPYSTLLYAHQLVAALFVAAFAILLRAPSRPPLLFLCGFLLGFAVVCDYTAILGCIALGLYARRRLGWILAGAVIPAIALAVYHTVAFGGPLTTAYAFSTQPWRHTGVFMGIGLPRPRAVMHLLFTQYRGIFFSMPWLLLAIPGAVMLIRRGERRAEGIVCTAMFLLFFWLNISIPDWQGGWALGARYLIPTLPFLTILAAAAISRRAVAVVFGVLAAYSFVLMLVGTAVKPEVSVMIGNPFTINLRTFAADRVAMNYQSIDSEGPRPGPRYAWNVGEKLGLRGRATLLPLLVWIAAMGGWVGWEVRRR